jgi:glycosyltransferase involved in cell wall biosynthesis
MNLRDVSVIVTTFNEEASIESCLAPLRGFGEIIVVDCFSCDATLEIARRFPAAIYQRPYASAASQKNWALDIARHRWVLVLDADEVVSEEILREIGEFEENSGIDGFWIRRESHYLGGPIRHCGWQRDKVLRFFDSTKGRYEDVEVHEEVSLGGRSSMLRGALGHYPYRRIEQHLDKIEQYSTRGAREFVKRGGRLAILRMLLDPPFRMFRMYVAQGGFLDGKRGFLLCLLSSYGVFLKYAKAWEYARCRREK